MKYHQNLNVYHKHTVPCRNVVEVGCFLHPNWPAPNASCHIPACWGGGWPWMTPPCWCICCNFGHGRAWKMLSDMVSRKKVSKPVPDPASKSKYIYIFVYHIQVWPAKSGAHNKLQNKLLGGKLGKHRKPTRPSYGVLLQQSVRAAPAKPCVLTNSASVILKYYPPKASLWHSPLLLSHFFQVSLNSLSQSERGTCPDSVAWKPPSSSAFAKALTLGVGEMVRTCAPRRIKWYKMSIKVQKELHHMERNADRPFPCPHVSCAFWNEKWQRLIGLMLIIIT